MISLHWEPRLKEHVDDRVVARLKRTIHNSFKTLEFILHLGEMPFDRPECVGAGDMSPCAFSDGINGNVVSSGVGDQRVRDE